eukprot:4353174-Alexandrium_andersonii.AAC.1
MPKRRNSCRQTGTTCGFRCLRSLRRAGGAARERRRMSHQDVRPVPQGGAADCLGLLPPHLFASRA